MNSKALWGGRFSESPDEAMLRFSTSLPIDSRLWRYDIQGSIAHVQMLARVDILTAGEAAQIQAGLLTVEADIEAGRLTFYNAPDEDIHSFIERTLTSLIGPVAGKLHTARSRNDQIALDVRLYLKDALKQAHNAIHELQGVLIARAEEQSSTILPGYTHLQRAQPVLLSHHLLAYFWMLQRDDERLREIYDRVDVLPLGAAALAGTTFPIDREFVARQLGFAAVSENSMDTVADRDHMIESTAALAIVSVHLSRLAEEFVLWSAPEFGFVTLDDRFATGSSIMPQKKNPDSMELVRGKSARVIGDLMSLLTLVKSLPLTYNRDLQEDKEPLFDAFDTTIACLQIARGVIETVRFHGEAMRAAAAGGFSTATDVADYLVRRGVPFREAHEIVGRIVNYCEQQGRQLEELSLAEWQGIDDRIEEGVLDCVLVENSVAARGSYGGTAPQRVQEQLERAKGLHGSGAAPVHNESVEMKSRIMYIENKSQGLTGPARIGRVTFSKTGRTIYYGGKSFQSLDGAGFKSNYYDVNTGDEYWISGCKKDGSDRLYGERVPVEIDEDVREEYWTEIRKKPENKEQRQA